MAEVTYDTEMDGKGVVRIIVELDVEDFIVALEEEGYEPSDENIATIAEGLGDKWMTDLTEVNELEFIVEVMADDLESDENNYKAHRDWRSRQET